MLDRNPQLVKVPPPVPEFEADRIRQFQLLAWLRLYEGHALQIGDSRAVLGRPMAPRLTAELKT
jgi:hypothetical protein